MSLVSQAQSLAQWCSEHLAQERAFLLKFNGVNDASSTLNITKKRRVAQPNPESDHYGGWKNRVRCFLPKNLIFNSFWPKTPRKHPGHLVKPIYGHQKAKKSPKNPKSTRNKKFSRAQMCCFRCFQGKKTHLNVSPLITWNLLTQKSTVFVVRIFHNDHLLSLDQNPATSSLYSQQKKKNWKKEKISEVRYQNVLSWNSKDRSRYTYKL